MIKQLFGFRIASIRLHPNTLTSVYEACLISFLGLACARRGLSRIAVTPQILHRATEMSLEETPSMVHPLIRERFEGIREMFAVYSRIDKPKNRAFTNDFFRRNLAMRKYSLLSSKTKIITSSLTALARW